MLSKDDWVAVPRPPLEEAAALLEDVFSRHQRAVAREPRLVPGVHCYRCRRPARCGAYPHIHGPEPTYRTRTLIVSKTQLAKAAVCQRAAAWRTLHAIPTDRTPDDDHTPGFDSYATGALFHETVAAALLSDDPQALYRQAWHNAPPSEAADLRRLFDNHTCLWQTDPHPVHPKATEPQIGVTLTVQGAVLDRHGDTATGPVAVVLAAKPDVTGWEQPDTAAVVEHRTGAASTALPHEADLYAAAAWAAAKTLKPDAEPPAVAVHFHHLRHDPPRCERHHYTPHQIRQAIQRLAAAAETIAGWHPADALHPPHNPGDHCADCPYQQRCLHHR